MRIRLLAAVLTASLVSACATTTPTCRAPLPEEMAAFRAIISHNPAALAQSMAPGPARTALESGDGRISSHLWGSQGNLRGSVVELLSPPPLCILPSPSPATVANMREILVYPQSRYDAVRPADPATPLPYGSLRRDYLTCSFTLTEDGYRLADACGYRAYAPTVTG